MFGKRQNLELHCLEKPKCRIAMFVKSKRLEFQCLEKAEILNFSFFQTLEF